MDSMVLNLVISTLSLETKSFQSFTKSFGCVLSVPDYIKAKPPFSELFQKLYLVVHVVPAGC